MSMFTEILLIFDCDGTLVDSEGIANRVFIDLVRDLGAPLTEQEAWNHFPGTSLRHCMSYVNRKYDLAFPEDFIPEYRKRQKVAFAKELQPVRGVAKALACLDGSKCVASNGPKEIVRNNLATTRLDHHFDDKIYSAYDIHLWKPLPDLFLFAADQMGFSIDKCIVIEDSLAGIEAAIQAKMKVLAYTPKDGPYNVQYDGVETICHMEQLPNKIKSLL